MSKHRMTSADAAWLHMDRRTNLMVVNALLWLEGPVDRWRLREVIRSRLVDRFPRFSQRVLEPRLGLGPPSWEDDADFELDLHMHAVALPSPGDRRALEDLIGDLISRPLDRERPLWEMHVIEGYGEGTVILSRMHHAIADGIALARVLLSLTDDQPDAGIAPPATEREEHVYLDLLASPLRAAAHAAGAIASEGVDLLAQPGIEARGLLRRAVADGRALGKLLLTGPDRSEALKGELGVAQRVAWSDPVSLEDVKEIGHRTGTTVNDVLVAALAGALRAYLISRHSPAEEMRVMVPINLRPLDKPLPRDLGNDFGLVYLTLPVDAADPAERLARVSRDMDEIKHSSEGPLSHSILGLVGMTPLPVEQRLIDVFAPKTSAVVTNVAGPRQQVFLAGTRVTGVLGWAPASGSISAVIAIFSYAGEVTVGLRTNARVVPDPGAITEAFSADLGLLREMALVDRDARGTTVG